jgi:molybdopterin molybdotransferase
MLSVDTVLGVIQQKISALAPQKVVLARALGQVLAEDLRMCEESPRFDRSMVDGFAVRACDVRAGAHLRLVGHLNAGVHGFDGEVQPGTCVRINTGAPMPRGADAVLMVEESRLTAAGTPDAGEVEVLRAASLAAGAGMQRRGSDVAAGTVVLRAGQRLNSAGLAVCAAAGAAEVVVRRLAAAVLTTGDELVSPGAVPQGGQIRNSNHPMLCGLLREAAFATVGEGTLLDLGSCGDDAPSLRQLLQRGLREADLMVVSGGMSMGTRDLVPPLLRELGVELLVEKVRMKPGKPFLLGRWEGLKAQGKEATWVAGLPGNPVSAFVTFQRLVRPAIARLLGVVEGPALVGAAAAVEMPPNGDREFYLPCRLRREGAALLAEPLPWKGSADLFTLARAEGLIVRPAEGKAVARGDLIEVLPF